MRMYLRPIGDFTKFSNLADYPVHPAEEAGFEWVEGEPPEDATMYEAPTLLQQLNALYQTLAPSDQLQYFPFLGGLYALMDQGSAAQAKSILAAIPTTGSAVQIQQQMLAVFP